MGAMLGHSYKSEVIPGEFKYKISVILGWSLTQI